MGGRPFAVPAPGRRAASPGLARDDAPYVAPPPRRRARRRSSPALAAAALRRPRARGRRPATPRPRGRWRPPATTAAAALLGGRRRQRRAPCDVQRLHAALRRRGGRASPPTAPGRPPSTPPGGSPASTATPARAEVTGPVRRRAATGVAIAGVGGGDRAHAAVARRRRSRCAATPGTLVLVAGVGRPRPTRYAALAAARGARRTPGAAGLARPAWSSRCRRRAAALDARPGRRARAVRRHRRRHHHRRRLASTPTRRCTCSSTPTSSAGSSPQGAQVVMSHEAVHVATDAATQHHAAVAARGLRRLRRPARRRPAADHHRRPDHPAGPPRTVPPAHLPGPAEFDTDATHLGAALRERLAGLPAAGRTRWRAGAGAASTEPVDGGGAAGRRAAARRSASTPGGARPGAGGAACQTWRRDADAPAWPSSWPGRRRRVAFVALAVVAGALAPGARAACPPPAAPARRSSPPSRSRAPRTSPSGARAWAGRRSPSRWLVACWLGLHRRWAARLVGPAARAGGGCGCVLAVRAGALVGRLVTLPFAVAAAAAGCSTTGSPTQAWAGFACRPGARPGRRRS